MASPLPSRAKRAMDQGDIEDDAEAASLLSTKSVNPTPDTLSKLIKRIRALTFKLLPLQVDLDEISNPTSRIITPAVIAAYSQAAGDFGEALPYCLLRARQTFVWDANHNTADYDEYMGRATACEVLARRIVHNSPSENLNSLMATRFRHRDWDGDPSNLSSALELAIDQHCTIFLSSNESQRVINALWSGEWIQQNNENHDIDYVPYEQSAYQKSSAGSFWRHLDPSRLSVPRYQNIFRIIVWVFFLFIYSQAVQSPLEKAEPGYPFEGTEVVLYIMAFSFSLEESYKLYRTLRYFTWRALGFWNVISLATDGLLITAFVLRILGLLLPNDPRSENWHLWSFQVLSCVAPLIWMKLITVVDGFKYIGTMQICISRMFQESTIFFLLLTILLAGFVQAMYALDAADGSTDAIGDVVNNLLQALMQSPDFTTNQGFNLILYYLWCACTTIILLNVLISLFASAYDDVVQDAEAQYLAFFAGKTVAMIRSPDSFLYPAPFNLIEIIFIAPFERLIDPPTYARINRFLMRVLFFIPFMLIALYEAYLDPRKNKFTKAWFEANEETDEDDPECQNPTMPDEEHDGEISKVPFDELIKAFPNTSMSVEATIITEIGELRARLEYLIFKLEQTDNK